MTTPNPSEMEAIGGLIKVLEEANALWPLFVGHPQTGEPVELSSEARTIILAALRDRSEGYRAGIEAAAQIARKEVLEFDAPFVAEYVASEIRRLAEEDGE